MLPELHTIILTQQYVLILLLVYWIVSIYKHNNILSSIQPTNSKAKLLMLLSGMLPIPGRIILCKSLMDGMTTRTDSRTGLASYICTHHYYLWSPMEKSVIVLIGGLSITYQQFIIYMLVPICVYMCYVVYYITTLKLKLVDTGTVTKRTSVVDLILLLICLIVSCYIPVITQSLALYLIYLTIKYKPPVKVYKSIDVKTLVFVSIVLMVGCIAKHNVAYIHEYMNNIKGDLYFAMLLSFVFSFILGSSSKFAGLCLLMTIIYGIEYMVLFYVIDFSGYLLSPTHKCTLVAQSGCKTPRKAFYIKLTLICVCMIICTGLYTWFVV